MADWLLYGANGYTGGLIARLAVANDSRPILAGRNDAAVHRLAEELGLEARVFALDDPATVDGGLSDVDAVLHCAGPFVHTAQPMVEACLRGRVHYLDITGEIEAFDATAARHDEAVEAGVVLLPGVGFDVVPSDCLAAHVAQRLPSATHLVIAVQALGRLSHGTALTSLEMLRKGGIIRRDGHLVSVPLADRTLMIDFGHGPRESVRFPWGDVATAYFSTGIPNIEVYMAGRGLRRKLMLARWLSPLLGLAPVQSLARSLILRQPPGPTDEQRANGGGRFWAEASDGEFVAVSRLETPEGYELTTWTALEAVRRVMTEPPAAGFQTPSSAFGPDFILDFEGTVREDV